MSLMFHIAICFVQVLLLTTAMEDRDDAVELFLSTRLPFSVKRGEIINVPIFVSNPLHYNLHVEITLNNSNAEYEIMDFDNKVISEKTLTRSIRLEDHSVGTVYYLIRPQVIGNVTLTFRASTSVDRETIHETLNVVPEGITQYDTNIFLVDLEREPTQKSIVELELPKDLVPDSQQVEVGIVGDIMGLILQNVENLVHMPTGSVEQTMYSLLPNYFIRKHLKSSKLLTPIVEAKLRHNLETGYQNIIICRHMDGSFSSFGPSRTKEEPRNGSTWLTSFVVLFLSQFKEFINVNETIIEKGLAFLSQQQDQKGTFTENGKYLHPSQRNLITLTSAAVLAFLENSAYGNKYLQNIARGLEFIAKNLKDYKLLHIHSLATYASKKAKLVSSEKHSLIKWLTETSLDIQSKWWEYVFLSDVEITSFKLLKLLGLNPTKIDSIEPTVKRLMAQHKNFGSFALTQDTVLGLIGLLKYTEFADYNPANMMDINLISNTMNETLKLTEDNGILSGSVELPPKTKSLKIAAKGNGSALIQIAVQYNTLEDQEDPHPSFTIKIIKIDDRDRPSYLTMLVCFKYVGEEETPNMALLEINIPSGYVITDENLQEIQKLKRVSYIEMRNSGSLLVVYFDNLYKDVTNCLRVDAFRTYAVAMQKPVPVLIYDYYNEDNRAVAFYVVDSKLCDICATPEECLICQ